LTPVRWIWGLAVCGWIAWTVYQAIVRRRIALPIRTLGKPWYIERDREPGMFWLVVVMHGLMFGFAAAVVVLGNRSA
jgi:hypothetical protein